MEISPDFQRTQLLCNVFCSAAKKPNCKSNDMTGTVWICISYGEFAVILLLQNRVICQEQMQGLQGFFLFLKKKTSTLTTKRVTCNSELETVWTSSCKLHSGNRERYPLTDISWESEVTSACQFTILSKTKQKKLPEQHKTGNSAFPFPSGIHVQVQIKLSSWISVLRYDLSSLRILGTVGEPINPEAWHWYHEVVGQGRCPVVDTFWQTETVTNTQW